MPASFEGLPPSPTALPTAAADRPLTAAWAGQPHWRLLELGTGTLTPFLQHWAAWQRDTARPRLLHYVLASPQAPLADALPTDDVLRPLAAALAPQLYGLLPGVHRISLDGGQVLLTLWLGDHQTLLRQQTMVADRVWLRCLDSTPAASPLHLLKALARQCRRGTALTISHADAGLLPALHQCGFVPSHPAETAPPTATDGMELRFDPPWTPRRRPGAHTPDPVAHAGTALVLGAGLAGSAVARSLALRGWQVTVLAAGHAPADGASGLPAGLFCPHVSPDDSVLSRLSRNGVRQTQERLRQLCTEGQDWAHSGVLEHCTDGGTGLPPTWSNGPGRDWSRPATAEQLAQAGLPADTAACWHIQAGWVRPAQLVRAQLQHPHIHCIFNAAVHQLQRTESQWQALDAHGQALAHADIAVLATGPSTAALLPPGLDWKLQAIRGQITWGPHTPDNATALPPFPVNGNGNLVTQVTVDQPTAAAVEKPARAHWGNPPDGDSVPGSASTHFWVMGSTFERDVTELPITHADQVAAHTANHDKLSTLLPASRQPMAPWFDPQDARCLPTWGRVRVASHDRLPIAGAVGPTWPGLWATTAMGSRGLTLSVLCGELLAARLHGEPLPLDDKLAQHLGVERLPFLGHDPMQVKT